MSEWGVSEGCLVSEWMEMSEWISGWVLVSEGIVEWVSELVSKWWKSWVSDWIIVSKWAGSSVRKWIWSEWVNEWAMRII